jgi:hypothetical protein
VSDDRYRERFVRWQSVAIAQLGYTVNLVLAFAVGSLGFALTLLRDKDFCPQRCTKVTFDLSLLFLLLSIGLGLWCVVNRLKDFRRTKDITRDGEQWKREKIAPGEIKTLLTARREEVKRLGRCTWTLFRLQIVTFGLGLFALFLVFLFTYHAKLVE